MKVGTDAILLSVLSPKEIDYEKTEENKTKDKEIKNILDIGTGSGIIALCMGQRHPQSRIIAIDIDSSSIKEAESNFKTSKFSNRIKAKEIDVFSFSKTSKERFDLIISNPPYFLYSLKSSDEKRNNARHSTASLDFKTLILSVKTLLKDNGVFSLILPKKESEIFIPIAKQEGLTLLKQTLIYPNNKKPCNRVVMLFTKNKPSLNNYIPKQEELFLRDENNNPTKEYTTLSKEFLL
jgi:tRNA1Val (adenine37-N6)-methyltransferase